jgi:hypothetical protein
MKELRKLIVKVAYIIYALKKVSKPHIGDEVIYQKERCILIQGVNDPNWDLMPSSEENFNFPIRIIYKNIHTSKFKLDRSFKRHYWAFKDSYRFKISNWFLIDTYNKSLFSSISKY